MDYFLTILVKDFNNNKEFYAYTLAVLVIGSFVFFFGYSLIMKPTIDTAKDVTSLYGGYVAAVLVYFFGQKQAQTLTTQAVKAEKERDAVQGIIDSMKTIFLDLVDQRLMIQNTLEKTEEKLKRLENDG